MLLLLLMMMMVLYRSPCWLLLTVHAQVREGAETDDKESSYCSSIVTTAATLVRQCSACGEEYMTRKLRKICSCHKILLLLIITNIL
jgi:hypothetical protein